MRAPLAVALAFLALAGCRSTPEEPERAFQLAGATGELKGLNDAQSCTCTLGWLDLHYTTQRQRLTVHCADQSGQPLGTEVDRKAVRRNERQLFVGGPDMLYATLGANRPDPRGKPYDRQLVFPLFIHLLRRGYVFPEVVGGDYERPLREVSLPQLRGELRDAMLWCVDQDATDALADGGSP